MRLSTHTCIRTSLIAAASLAYAAAVAEHDQPLIMAVGLAPIAWIWAEALWRLFSPSRGRAAGEQP